MICLGIMYPNHTKIAAEKDPDIFCFFCNRVYASLRYECVHVSAWCEHCEHTCVWTHSVCTCAWCVCEHMVWTCVCECMVWMCEHVSLHISMCVLSAWCVCMWAHGMSVCMWAHGVCACEPMVWMCVWVHGVKERVSAWWQFRSTYLVSECFLAAAHISITSVNPLWKSHQVGIMICQFS